MKYKRPIIDRLLEKISLQGGCLVWTAGRKPKGYGAINVGRSSRMTHRLMYEEFFGSIPDGMCVCHRCDNPPCINPAHLFLGTKADNIADMDAKGRRRTPAGESHYGSKINKETAAHIRSRKAAGATGSSLAKEFGISPALVSMIASGRRWADGD